MPVLRAFANGVTTINRWLMIAASLLVFVIVPVMLYEVTLRYFFNAPTVWAMELATLLFGPYFMLAGPYLLHVGGHVNVDIVHGKLPPRIAAAVECLTMPVIMGFAAVLMAKSWPIAVNALALRETSFSAWNPEIWPFKFIIPIAMGMMLLQAVAEFALALERVRAGDDREVRS